MSSRPTSRRQSRSPSKSSQKLGTKTIPVKTRGGAYPIIVSDKGWSSLITPIKRLLPNRQALIITDQTVARQVLPELRRRLQRAGLKVAVFSLPTGERHKHLATVQRCYDWLLEQGADRHSTLIALGGGVVGDIVGFVAATYMRGVPFIQIPTTLVAQVDSSVGGKVGVDHQAGKNLIGAFYQPKLVAINIKTLTTLPEREYLCGLAEVIKYAAIYDIRLFRFLKREVDGVLDRRSSVLRHIVETCCRIKAQVVKRDEKETTGHRMILNFGHTVGHAIEKLTQYRRWGHGEAVALGMRLETAYSVRKRSCTRADQEALDDLLDCYGLPRKQPRYSKKQWLQALSRDKKMAGDKLHFVFLKKLGQVVVKPIKPEDLAGFLVEL